MLSSWIAAPRASGGQLMTYGRSIEKSLDHFLIDRATWATLAADRAAWRDAIHGGLLDRGRLTRDSATATNRLVADSLANERAGAGEAGLVAAAKSALMRHSRRASSTRAALSDVTNLPTAQ